MRCRICVACFLFSLHVSQTVAVHVLLKILTRLILHSGYHRDAYILVLHTRLLRLLIILILLLILLQSQSIASVTSFTRVRLL